MKVLPADTSPTFVARQSLQARWFATSWITISLSVTRIITARKRIHVWNATQSYSLRKSGLPGQHVLYTSSPLRPKKYLNNHIPVALPAWRSSASKYRTAPQVWLGHHKQSPLLQTSYINVIRVQSRIITIPTIACGALHHHWKQ